MPIRVHYCARTEHAPGADDKYIALCGYASNVKKEFRFDSIKKVTCEKCLNRSGKQS